MLPRLAELVTNELLPVLLLSLQLVSLHCHHPGNAAAMYTLSRSSTQEYPLAVVSLNMTKFTLQVGGNWVGRLLACLGRQYAATCLTYPYASQMEVAHHTLCGLLSKPLFCNVPSAQW